MSDTFTKTIQYIPEPPSFRATVVYHDKGDLRLALDADDMYAAIYKFSEYLRYQYKHAQTEPTLEQIREQYQEIMHRFLEI